MVGRAQERAHLKAGWVAADDAFGMSPSFRDGLAALGMWYVLDVPSGFTVWPPEPAWTSVEYQGFGRPRKPRLRSGQRRTMQERSDELPEAAWHELTVAEGSQGPRSYLFSAQRVRPTSRRKPGEIHWAIYRRNLDGSEPRYYLRMALCLLGGAIPFFTSFERASRRARCREISCHRSVTIRCRSRTPVWRCQRRGVRQSDQGFLAISWRGSRGGRGR